MISRREAIIDLSVVLSCSTLYFVASFFHLPIIPVIIVILVAVAVFALFFLSERNETWKDYGFRLDNWKQACIGILVPTALVMAIMMMWGWWDDRRPDLGLLLFTVLYLPWAVVQQFIFQGVVHRRWKLLVSPWLAVVITSLCFAAIHAPDWDIMALTLLGGFAWSICYAMCPNLWALGLSHGLLASVAYVLLLGENPMERFF